MSEATTERDILQYLAHKGYWARRTHSGYRKPVATGMLDIVFAKGGIWGAIEVKSDTGKPTAEQWQEIERIQAAGGRAFVARSLDEVVGKLL